MVLGLAYRKKKQELFSVLAYDEFLAAISEKEEKDFSCHIHWHILIDQDGCCVAEMLYG
jgi:hypothetical protein